MTTSKQAISAAMRKEHELSDTQSDVLNALFASADNVVTAQELSDAVDKKSKSVRAFMRSSKLRDQSVEKNNRWGVSLTQAIVVVKHYIK